MNYSDLFVGAVSATLGVSFIVAAALNAEWCVRFLPVRVTAGRSNRNLARLACVGLGLLLVALGVAIVGQVALPWPWLNGG